MKPVAYEGPENYIFISYAHRDSDIVMRILSQMADRGYNIWYDDGIAPGSEWPENIAEHLTGSTLVLAFTSNNSVASANCRREVTFAMAKQKKFLGVLLEPTQMSPGMEMQMSAQQCIMRYNYSREEDFIQKLLSCPELEECRSRTAAMSPQTEEEAPPETEAPPEAEAPPKAEVPSKIKKEKKSRAKKEKPPSVKGKKKLFLILGAALALIAAVVLIWCLTQVKLTSDIRVSVNEDSITLREEQITAKMISQLNRVKKLKYLYLYDCVLEPGAMAKLKGLALTTLSMNNCSGESDYTFLENIPQLQYITLSGCGVTDDNFAIFASAKPIRLDLSGNPGVTDLSFLNLEKLTELNLSGTGVSDLSCLKDAWELKQIYCADTRVKDITPLADLQKLQIMDFSRCPITEVGKEFLSLSMQSIYFSNTGLINCDGFRNFTVLRCAYLDGNLLTNVDWLSKSVDKLEEVALSGNPLTAESYSFLSTAFNLKKLYLDKLPMENLSIAGLLQKLEVLSAKECGITNVSVLSGLPSLKKVYLSGNAITDVSGLPALNGAYDTILDLADNAITDISGLPACNYQVLALHGNPLTFTGLDLSGLKGTHLSVDYAPDITSCTGLSFYNMYIQDCPLDQQLLLTETFSYKAQYLTLEQIQQILATEGVCY